MAKFEVCYSSTYEIEIDESKFTDEFMEEFRQHFFPFYDLEDHAEHIAQMQARGVIDIISSPEFVEGYGPSNDMGIKVKFLDAEIYSNELDDN